MSPKCDATCPELTDEQIDKIAERAATVALERVYTHVGRSVLTNLLFMAGAACLALFAYFKGKGLA